MMEIANTGIYVDEMVFRVTGIYLHKLKDEKHSDRYFRNLYQHWNGGFSLDPETRKFFSDFLDEPVSQDVKHIFKHYCNVVMYIGGSDENI